MQQQIKICSWNIRCGFEKRELELKNILNFENQNNKFLVEMGWAQKCSKENKSTQQKGMKQAHKKQLKSIGKILFDKDSYYIENQHWFWQKISKMTALSSMQQEWTRTQNKV